MSSCSLVPPISLWGDYTQASVTGHRHKFWLPQNPRMCTMEMQTCSPKHTNNNFHRVITDDSHKLNTSWMSVNTWMKNTAWYTLCVSKKSIQTGQRERCLHATTWADLSIRVFSKKVTCQKNKNMHVIENSGCGRMKPGGRGSLWWYESEYWWTFWCKWPDRGIIEDSGPPSKFYILVFQGVTGMC